MQTLRDASPKLPALVETSSFHCLLIHFDILHVCYRGFAADYVVSVLQELFSGDSQMAAGHRLAKMWCKSQGLELACEEFSLDFEGGFAALQAKGMDVKILCCWLVSCETSGFAMFFFS